MRLWARQLRRISPHPGTPPPLTVPRFPPLAGPVQTVVAPARTRSWARSISAPIISSRQEGLYFFFLLCGTELFVTAFRIEEIAPTMG